MRSICSRGANNFLCTYLGTYLHAYVSVLTYQINLALRMLPIDIILSSLQCNHSPLPKKRPLKALLHSQTLAMGWHFHARLGSNRVLAPPKARYRLGLRVKVQPRFPIKRIGTTARNALLVSGEAEHGQRHRDRHIDADLAGLDVFSETCRGTSATGEDGDAVAVFVRVDEIDGVVHSRNVEADKDGAEDLFSVAFHVGLHIRYQCGTNLSSERALVVCAKAHYQRSA